METKALADAGLAHVQAGRVAEGMALLDEAMALACGPAPTTPAVAEVGLLVLHRLLPHRRLRRADSWAELLRRHGLIGRTPGAAVFLSSHCDSVQATLLVELGRWGEAEAVLARAADEFERHAGPDVAPAIVLADLRIRQGRLAEAERCSSAGPVHGGAAAHGRACTSTAATTTSPAPPPAAACASSAPTASGPPSC